MDIIQNNKERKVVYFAMLNNDEFYRGNVSYTCMSVNTIASKEVSHYINPYDVTFDIFPSSMDMQNPEFGRRKFTKTKITFLFLLFLLLASVSIDPLYIILCKALPTINHKLNWNICKDIKFNEPGPATIYFLWLIGVGP